MSRQTEEIVQTLKDKRLRVTPQRFAVYANLLGRTDHPTAEQILNDLNQDAPVSSQATIYNCLQALQEVGLIREVLLDEGGCRYDANVEPHHHFRCQSCGAIADIPWQTLQPIDVTHLNSDWQVNGYEVTVHGTCKGCQT
ncbi:MAG: transcriptional repressor [Leptolyngbya sp. SIOISBB]|nr:transcriptional repressor [Leptolyngbya sp. SIOISBB]